MNPADDFAGDPDGLQRLWTPHRMAYIDGDAKPADASENACPFCAAVSGDDESHLVVARGSRAYVILNLFPYNSGHVLVCPNRHVADYTDLTVPERDEVAELSQQAMLVVRAVLNPHGFNLGMNQGDVAGAGIAAHLHQHIVPRWLGDANFFPIVAQTKAMPQLLSQTRDRLAAAWPEQTTRTSETS
ncbi:HIT domain-containing protein [Rarobacter faecitabidus]|uniref:HIT family protein n=1 Tax=Rarobacter faecitabidus TaxID=13243 RepID=UPI00319DFA27